MFSCDLAQALTEPAVAKDGLPVEFKWFAPDLPAFEPGPAHAGPDPFDDQVAFEFRDGPDDDHDGAAQRAAGVDLFAETDELDVQAVERVQDLEEVPG